MSDITSDADRPVESGRLSPNEAGQLASELAAGARSGLPLDGLLRVCAEELGQGHMASAFRTLADDLAAGKPLETALQQRQAGLGRPLAVLLSASARGGRFASMLDQWLAQERKEDELRRYVLVSLAYPLLLIALMAVVFAFCLGYLANQMTWVSGNFDTMISASEGSRAAAAYWVSGCVLLGTAFLGALILWPKARWAATVIEVVPLIGPIWRWHRQSRFAAWMAIMIDAGFPLHESMELAAEGMDHGGLRRAYRDAAKELTAGGVISQCLGERRLLGASVIPLLEWGQRQSALGAAFRAASVLLEGRSLGHAAFLRSVAPQIAFLAIAIGTASCVGAMLITMRWVYSLYAWWQPYPFPTAPSLLGGFLSAIGAAAFGAAILFAMQLMAETNAPLHDSAIEHILRIVAWVFLICGPLVFASSQVWWFAPVLWFVSLAVAFDVLGKRRQSRQLALLELLAVAEERGISFGDALLAFAAEMRGRFSRQVRKLAVALEGGMPFVEALRRNARVLPREVIPMLDLGGQEGRVSLAMRRLLGRRRAVAETLDMLWTRLIAGCVIGNYALGILAFYINKIIPSLNKILHEFGMAPSGALRTLGEFDYRRGSWLFLMFLLSVSLTLLLFYAIARRAGIIGWNLPGTGWLAQRLHAASVLDALSLAVAQEMPMPEALERLAASYPKWRIRRRLIRTLLAVRQGKPWHEVLAEQGLLRPQDWATLQAAERVANLPWAMQEIADGNRRRFVVRSRIVEQTVLPIAVLALAGLVFAAATAVLAPLIEIMERIL